MDLAKTIFLLFSVMFFAFWVGTIILIVAIPLCFVLVGIPIVFALAIWYLYRNVRGLIRAIDGQPY